MADKILGEPRHLYERMRLDASRAESKVHISYNEFKEYLEDNDSYNDFLETWKESNYSYRYAPTITRIDKLRPYTLDNITITIMNSLVYRKIGGKIGE